MFTEHIKHADLIDRYNKELSVAILVLVVVIVVVLVTKKMVARKKK